MASLVEQGRYWKLRLLASIENDPLFAFLDFGRA